MTVWGRLRRAIGRLVGERVPEPEDIVTALHWRPNSRVAAVACDAMGYIRWTAESKVATCPDCQRAARLMILQRGVNSR